MRKFFTQSFIFILVSVCTFFVQTAFGQLSLTKLAPSATIDFSANTPAGVGTSPGTAFTGAGFSPAPLNVTGRLNSNAWAVTGWSDGNLINFGGTVTSTGDHARGAVSAAQTTGGMYAYTGSPASAANPMLMIQPGGSDFAPGTLTLRIQNNGTTAINQMAVSYNLYSRNDQDRANSFNFSYSSDNSSYIPVTALNYTSPMSLTAAAPMALVGNKSTTITGLNIAPGDFFYVRWSSADAGGTGSRDEFGLDDIVVAGTYQISSNADLSNLQASAGTLPSFSSSTTSYSIAVANGVSSTTITPTAADPGATITVNGTPVSSGSSSPVIPLAVGANTITIVVTAENGTTNPYTINISRANPATPVLSIGATPAAFGSICINTTAGPNSFTLNGVDLDGTNITINALTGFSFAESAAGPYSSSLSFPAGGTLSGKPIYVQFTPTIVGSYGGFITINGGGAAAVTVAVNGNGINTAPTVVTGTNTVNGTSAILNGSISTNGCSAVTNYGFEYNTSSGFANGTGTQVIASNLSGGGFSKLVTGLTGGVTYYYKAFATNNGGTVYGAENSFTASAIVPVAMAAQPLFRYTENFGDINNWSNNFVTGIGANRFSAVTVNASGSIPAATKVTTSSASFSTNTAGGVQKGTGSIILLSTGSDDNTSSVAIDFYMDFTGVNAGTLSFDWATINNSLQSGSNRTGSLRVYATVDGLNFIELTQADVLNFVNGVPATGTVNSIALPAIFNNSATARLRFYYHNGSGGSSGSRPKMSIDNLTVTGVASTPCATPSAGPTALGFGTIAETSIQGSFTAASPAANEYLVIVSTNSSLTSNPIDGQVYNVGDNVGDGDVVAKGNLLSFTASGLDGATTYYFFIFPLNSVCTGGPLYSVANVLTGTATTVAGLPPCAAPADQATNLVFLTPGINSIQASFTVGSGNEYLVLQSTSASLSGTPVNGQSYSPGDVIGNAKVIQRSSNTSFTASGLTPATNYYYYIISLNSQACVNGPVYNTSTPLAGSATTQPLPVCVTPTAQPINLVLNASNSSVNGSFNGVSGSGYYYLVVRSSAASLSAIPVNGNDYAVGSSLGGGTVVANGSGTSFSAGGLNAVTQYYFFVFSMDKNCSGGTKYLTASPLTGNITTTNTPPNNIYFGTLHSHSDYSDGNKDHPGYTPTDDYNYALGSQHMDFLGISEHNHFSSLDNPGNELAKYHSGITEASNFTAAHPGFLALYGMEWGVISGGGHVVVYGDGMSELFGWESNVNGNVGPNYDVYVPKSVYTGPDGLFKNINDFSAKNAFATLAHPNNSDYNNLSNIAFDAQADSAITGVAVESGPATSTNTSYSNPASPLFYLWYYQKLLSKGYHLGPTIDHDNHNTTFGRTTKSRTAVIAPALTQTEVIKAVRNMHFYATEDYDTKVDFTINNRIMGSVFEDLNAPSISVNVSDPTDDYSNALIRVMYGVPGSGVLPVVIDSVFGSSLSYIDNNLANNGTGYYYIDITKGTTRTVTSPIWYTRKCAISTEFSITACGSYNWNGTIYTTSVTDTKTFTTTGGCDSTVTMHLTIQANVTDINNGNGFCTIQAGINDPQTLPGHTLEVQPGNYNEQVKVTKGVTIKGVGATQPVVNFTGTPTGKKTVFDVSVANVTINNLNIKVDLTKLSSGIIASGSSISNLVITTNKIDAYSSSSTASIGSYTDRNAVSINYSGATNYRVAGAGGVSNISFLGNTVTGMANDGFGVPRYFRSGVSADDASGVFNNNTLQSINHDVIVRFGNTGSLDINNNIFNGGGVELTDFNSGATALTISNNQFNAAFANTAAANTAVLRLKNNFNSRNTFVTGNTFKDAEWGLSLENYNSVTVLNNSFTPLAGSTAYHHLTVNTKTINTNSATIQQKPISASINSNTFNGSGANGGTALMFLNHDNDAAAYGPFVIGMSGAENSFNAGIKTFVALDAQSGLSGSAVFPNYPSVIGTGTGAVTTMAPWSASLFMVNNKFDVGTGLKLTTAMNSSELFSLEDMIQHQIDASPLGFVLVKAGNDYVTVNSSLSPLNSSASIQRGIDAASNGFIVNVGPGVFTDNVTVNKSVLVQGAGEANTKVIPAVSNPDCGGAGGGSLCAGGSNVFLVRANNVQISQLTIDGNNPAISSGTIVDGADIDARNGIITDHNAGVFNGFTVSHVTVQNIFLRGIYASSGGSFQFNNNTVSNVQGNSSSIGIFNYGGAGQFLANNVSNTSDAIASNWSKGSVYNGNNVTNSGSGIHTDNNGGSGGTADIIQGNTVSNSKPNGYGIWVFAPYVPSLVRGNTVSNVDVGLAAAGQQAAVTPLFDRNTVDGQNKPNSTGVYVTTDLFGFGTSDVSAVFQNNFIRNNADGFYLESEAGRALNLQAHGNSITGNTNSSVTQGTGASGAGSFVAEMQCNWWGTTSTAAIAAGINGAAVVFNPRLVNGTDTDPAGPGFQPIPSCADPIANAAVTSQVDVNCYGSGTGAVTIEFSNGTPGFNYSLDGGAPVSIGGSPFGITALAAGTHTVVITDADGNSTSVSFTILQPAAPISANYSFTPISCNGGLSTESVTILGGTAPYSVLNQGGGALVTGAQEGVTYTGSTYAADYLYRVTDAKGCEFVFTVHIPEPPVLIVTATATDIPCAGGASTVNVSASGGTAPYNGTGSFNVTAGTYTYTVTDANGCTASATVTASVVDLIKPTISSVTSPVFCENPTGNYNFNVITANDNCGIASISYDITGSTTRSGAGNNASGAFSVGVSTITWTVTDVNGNSSTAAATVTVQPAPAAPAGVDASRCGPGLITLSATAQTGETIDWYTAANGGSLLAANTSVYTLNTPNTITVYAQSKNTSTGCTSLSRTAVTATIKSIPPPISYTSIPQCGFTIVKANNPIGTLVWSPNHETTDSIIVTVPGTYSAVQTVNGCTSQPTPVNINVRAIPPAPAASIVDNCGSSTITAVASLGGLLVWSTGPADNGHTTVTVTGTGPIGVREILNGCAGPITTVTANPKPVPPVPVITVVKNCGSTVLSTNATGNLLWSTGETGSTITVTTDGTYSVTVSNAANCSASASAAVTVNTIPVVAPIVGASTVVSGSSTAFSNTTPGGVWSSDNSSVATVNSSGLVTGGTVGSTTINYTVTSAANCSTSVSAPITVTPNCTAPVLTASNVTANTQPSATTCNSPVTYTVSTTGTSPVTLGYVLSGATTGSGSGTGSGVVFNVGVTTVKVTATNACGSSSTTFTVTLKDGTAPVPVVSTLPTLTGQCSVSLASGNNGCDDDCSCCRYSCHCRTNSCNCRDFSSGGYRSFISYLISYLYNYYYGDDDDHGCDHDDNNAPKATDNCKGTVLGTTSDPLTYNSQGTYTIHWKYDDGNGNITIQEQTVIVKDDIKPVISCPGNITIKCGASTAATACGSATATDNCGGVTISYTDVTNASGTQILRTWKATDAAGNYSTCVQTITIGSAFNVDIASVPTGNVYTGGIATNLYLGYGAQSTALQTCALPSAGAPYTYAWSGSAVSRLNSTSSAAPVFSPNTYGSFTFMVTATNKYGCTSTDYITICVTDIRVPGTNGNKVYVCHQTNGKTKTSQTIAVSINAVATHLGNGSSNGCGNKDNDDRLGSCDQTPCGYTSVNSVVSAGTQTQTVTPEGGVLMTNQKTTGPDEIKVIVSPNPSTSYFTLKFESRSNVLMNLRVMDGNGRVVDARSSIVPNTSLQIGHAYSSGTYYAEVIQGGQRKVVQLIKGRG